MTETSEWTGAVGGAWAEEWRRTDRSFGALTDRLLDPRALGGFGAALDIGCGAGELVARLAGANPAARVIGVDISAELIAVARERSAHLANAQVVTGDASSWCPEQDCRPDLLISRHGVMFFADPAAAFAHLRAQSAPEARLRFSCFRARDENGWAAGLASVLRDSAAAPGATAPGPFAFGNPAHVEALLNAAGWGDVAFEPVDYSMIAGDGEHAIEEAMAYFQRIGPAARAIRDLPETERPAVRARLRKLLSGHCVAGRVTMPAAAWIVTARRASGGSRL